MSISPYYYPPPPMPYRPGQGKAVASMVLGIGSLVFCWWGLATLAMVILAITLGGTSMRETSRVRQANHGMAVAGLILGIIGGVAYLIIGVLTLGVFLIV